MKSLLGSTSGEDEQNLEMKANCENQDEEAKKKSMKNGLSVLQHRQLVLLGSLCSSL